MSTPAMKLICVVLGLVVLAGPTFAGFTYDLEKLKDDDSPSISASGGMAQRNGSTLTLKLANGRSSTFIDTDKCDGSGGSRDPQCAIHRLVGYESENKAFVILNVYYEWGDFELVSELTGVGTLLPGQPHFSPSGSLFVVAEAHDCCGDNTIQIWRANHGYPSLEWQHVPKGFGYDFSNWIDENHIELTISAWTKQGKFGTFPAHLIYRNLRWRLQNPPEVP